MNKKENVLKNEQILSISQWVEQHPTMKDPNCINIGCEWTDVIKVTPKHNLVFIKGNEDTGFEHILNRHNFWSTHFYWNGDRTQDQSKFSKKIIPIIDFSIIADTLFDVGNKDLNKNNSPELFDVYSGICKIHDNEEKFRMILYKNSKIIHSLFPIRDKHNIKRIKEFARGEIAGIFELRSNVASICIPYTNPKKEFRYELIINRKIEERIDEYFVNVYKKDNLFVKCDLGFHDWPEDGKFTIHDMRSWIHVMQYSEIKKIENKIVYIDCEVEKKNRLNNIFSNKK